MFRKINWTVGIFRELSLFYERFDQHPELLDLLDQLEEQTLMELRNNVSMVKLNQRKLEPEDIDKLSEKDKVQIICQFACAAITEIKAERYDKINLLINPELFLRFPGCAMFRLIDYIENNDGSLDFVVNTATFAISLPPGDSKGWSRHYYLIMKLYPWVRFSEESAGKTTLLNIEKQFPNVPYSLSSVYKMGISELIAASIIQKDAQYLEEMKKRLLWCGFDEKFAQKFYELEDAIILLHGCNMPDRFLSDQWWWAKKVTIRSMLPYDERYFTKPHKGYTLEDVSEDTLTFSEILSFLDEANFNRTTANKAELFTPESLAEIDSLAGNSWLRREAWMHLLVCGADPDTQSKAMEQFYKQEIHLLAKNKYDYLMSSWESYAGMKRACLRRAD